MSKEEMLEKLKSDLDTLKTMGQEFKLIENQEQFEKPASNIYSSKSIRQNIYSAILDLNRAVMSIEFAIETIETGRFN